MKKGYILIILTLIFPILSYAQISWIAQNSGTTASLDGVYFVDENNGWVSGWGQIILHTINGGETWGLQNTPVSSLHCIFFTDLQNGWSSGLGGDVIHTTNGGETWVFQDNLDYQDIFKLFFIDENNGWAAGGFFDYLSGSYGRAIYNTTDGGLNWNVQYDVTFETELQSIYFLDSNTGYAAGGIAVMKTTNGGSSWFVQQSLSGFGLKDIVFINNATGFVTGQYVGVPHYSVIFKTTDAGNNWNEISLGTNEALSGLYFTDELNGWAVGVDYSSGNSLALIYRTTDGGNNWVKQNIPPFDAVSQVFFVNDTKGWAVGSLGTIITTESSVPVELSSFTADAADGNVNLNWKTESEKNNSGFEVERLKDYKIAKLQDWEKIGFVEGQGTTTEENSYSFVDNEISSGQYQYRLKQIDYDGSFKYSDVVQVGVSAPQEFSLQQNYPNPFNPSTKIKYSVPQLSKVQIIIFDALGNEIEPLVNKEKQAGTYEITWDAANLPSGVYFYQLRATPGDGQAVDPSAGSGQVFIQIKKMILLK